MARELSFVLINPYTIAKSRTGGVIGRIISRTGLDIVGARMFGPGEELVSKYAALMGTVDDIEPKERTVLADYVRTSYAPDPKAGRRRVLMLLFEGDDAVAKVRNAVGTMRPNMTSGESVRDTFGDYIVDGEGRVRYIEPAVMTARSVNSAGKVLRLWAEYSATDGGLIEKAGDVPRGEEAQRTLVIIKPDNFRFPSARPGNIIDIFSASGLRIVGAKVQRMSVAQAEEFYGPVREVLRGKLKGAVADRGATALANELGLTIPEDVKALIGEKVGPIFGDMQFSQIIEFMTGRPPDGMPDAEKRKPGTVRSLVLIYMGAQAVEKIRKILGPTDPRKAEPGSVRKEFGQDIMINAAHASDSPENAKREMGILKPEEDNISELIKQYYG